MDLLIYMTCLNIQHLFLKICENLKNIHVAASIVKFLKVLPLLHFISGDITSAQIRKWSYECYSQIDFEQNRNTWCCMSL